MNKVNQSFKISASEACSLWRFGVPLSAESGRHHDDWRIRRSEDGKWVVRAHDLFIKSDFFEHLAGKLIVSADAEMRRLRRCGINVISYAYTASPENGKVLTISPWINDMQGCNDQEYHGAIYPRLTTYFDEARSAGIEPKCAELGNREQFSRALDLTPAFFMHDSDPRSVVSVNAAGLIAAV